MDVARFRELPVLGIARGLEPGEVAPLAETAVAAGLRAIEITMNTAGAPALIRAMVEAGAGRLAVGAGTVLTLADLDAALEAGATFAVLPTVVPDVVRACVQRDVPVFPGALTPTEIQAAWAAGATMVKVFPAGAFGPGYFREIKGPFADIELLACGGVTAETLPAYVANGASAVAFGASVFRREWLAAGAYDRIGAEITGLVAAWRRLDSASG